MTSDLNKSVNVSQSGSFIIFANNAMQPRNARSCMHNYGNHSLNIT